MKCEDLYKGRTIAIKIIKNVKKYREAAKLEINVLNKLAKYDPKVMIGPEKCQNGGCCGKIKRSGLKPVRPHVRLLRLPWAPVHRLRAPRFVKRMKTLKLSSDKCFHRPECVRLLEGQQLSSLSCGAGV